MFGKGTEVDNGPTLPLPNPCMVDGTININPGAALGITGSESVSETPTASR
jgi:hypothetical protein